MEKEFEWWWHNKALKEWGTTTWEEWICDHVFFEIEWANHVTNA